MNKFFLSLATVLMLTASCKDDKATAKTDNRGTIGVEQPGGTVQVPQNPERVVVLHYGIADTMAELGIPIAGLPKSTLPAYLAGLPESAQWQDIGNIMTPNLEKINELDPELIIISGRQAKLANDLNKLAATVNLDVDASNYMESFKKNQRAIGEIFGKEAEVEKELTDIDARIEEIRKKAAASGKKALIVLANEGKLSAYGKGSRFGIVHDVFGMSAADEGIEVSTHGQVVSNEYIKEKNPDYLFVIDRGGAINREALSKEKFANDLIKATDAYKNDRIVFLSPDIWYLSGGGLKSIKLMLSEMETALNR